MTGSSKSLFLRRIPGPIGSPIAYWFTGFLCLSAFLVPLQKLQTVPQVCIFHRLTGVPCPGCGLSRSVVASAHFDIATALSFHIFGPLFLLVCIVVFVLSTLQRFLGLDIPWKRIGVWSKWPIILVSVTWLTWAAHRALLVALR